MSSHTLFRASVGATLLMLGALLSGTAGAQPSAADLKARCAANPEGCDAMQARGQMVQDQCAANPEACEQGKATVRGSVDAAKAKGEDYCAQNPQACADASATADMAKETCTDPTACDELKSDAKLEAKDRLRDRLNARQSSGE